MKTTARRRARETEALKSHTTQAMLEAIAQDHCGFDTLETRGSDALDFSDVSAASMKAALEAAFALGFDVGRGA